MQDYASTEDGRRIDPGHKGTRGCLRVVGPVVLVVGIAFTVTGIASLLSCMGGSEWPRYFWCAFVGMPVMFVGLVLTKIAYLGKVARYMAAEAAPVAKDTINYMADGTKDSVKTMTRAVGEGLREGLAGASLLGGGTTTEPVERIRCHKCNEANDASARFCNHCGAPLEKTQPCPACGELNDPDARFCDNCGRPMR